MDVCYVREYGVRDSGLRFYETPPRVVHPRISGPGAVEVAIPVRFGDCGAAGVVGDVVSDPVGVGVSVEFGQVYGRWWRGECEGSVDGQAPV